MPKTLKIAFSGAHGTGKTEAADRLAAWLERQGTPVVRIPSVARLCPWPINKEASPEAQRWIFHRHALEEMDAGREAEARGGAVICDRTLADSLIYAEWQKQHRRKCGASLFGRWGPWDWLSPAFDFFLRAALNEYCIVFLTRPDGRPVAEDGVRSPDGEWRAEIAADYNMFWRGVKYQIESNDLKWPAIWFYPGPEKAARWVRDAVTAGTGILDRPGP
jgi:hypothetical protein